MREKRHNIESHSVESNTECVLPEPMVSAATDAVFRDYRNIDSHRRKINHRNPVLDGEEIGTVVSRFLSVQIAPVNIVIVSWLNGDGRSGSI